MGLSKSADTGEDLSQLDMSLVQSRNEVVDFKKLESRETLFVKKTRFRSLHMDFSSGPVVKNLLANAGDTAWVRSLI